MVNIFLFRQYFVIIITNFRIFLLTFLSALVAGEGAQPRTTDMDADAVCRPKND